MLKNADYRILYPLRSERLGEALSFDTSVVCPILIGRKVPLASFERVFAQVRHGQGQTVLVSGEAGIGKSRLVAEVIARIGQEQVQFLHGACFEQDRSLPFAPLLDVLRTLLVSAAREATLRSLAPFAPELIKLLPDLALWLPDVTPTPALEPEQETRRLFLALTSFLLEQADQGPVLLVIEDLHWCDETSLEFLCFLTRHLATRPLLLLLTYRNEEVHPPLARFLSALNRERVALECSLTALTLDEVHAMLRAIFPSKRPVRRDFLEALYQLTEGNPFFVEEVLKSLLAAGDIFFADGIWDRKPLAELHIPRSIRDAVQQRISLLGEQAREVLALAAVVGRYVEFSLLQAVTGRLEAELLAVLDTLIAAQLVVESSTGQYAFRHALTQQAVYQGLLASRRKALHLTIGQTIEHLYASTLEAHLPDLAYHFYQAQAWTEALNYEQRLGERALALYAPHAALEHFTRAIEAAKHLPEANPILLYRTRGQAYDLLGNFEAARSDLEQALQFAHATGDRQQEWQSLIALGLLWTGHDYSQSSAFFQQALDLAEALGDPQKYMLSQDRLVYRLIASGQPTTAITMLERAVEILHQQAETAAEAQRLELLASATFFYGDWCRAVKYFDQAIALARALGDKRILVTCLTIRSSTASPILAETAISVPGSRAESRQGLEEALHLADAIEWRAGQAFVRFIAGWILASFGNVGEGLALARQGRAVATEIESLEWMAGSSCGVGEVYLMLLDPAEAITVLEDGLVTAQRLGSTYWICNCTASLAQAYLLAGDLPHTEAILEHAMADDQIPRNSSERRMAWAWGELALAQQRPDRALCLANELVASAPGQAQGQPTPALLKLRGEALFALGQMEEAIQTLEEARRGAQKQHAPHLLWRVHRTLGHIYIAAKQKQHAHSSLTAAREIIMGLAASLDATEQREHFLNAALSSMPKEPSLTPRQAAKQMFGGLSEREREIVLLIAQGKSSREIAEALAISQRTVETHVGNIYTKLGFSSRAQLAAWTVEKRLTADLPG